MKLEKATLVRVGVAIFLLYLCIYYWSGVAGFAGKLLAALSPLLLGFLIAYFVNILLCRFESLYFSGRSTPGVARSRRPVCMLLSYLCLLAIVMGVIWLIVPELTACVQLLVQEIPRVWNSAGQWLEQEIDPARWDQLLAFLGDPSWDWQSVAKNVVDWFISGFGGVMGTMAAVVSRAFSTLATAFVSIIFSVYLLADKERLWGQITRLARHYLRERWVKKAAYVLGVFHRSFQKFIVGQCVEAVILGILCTLGMHLLRFPYATMVGALVGFTALIPIAGAYIGAGVGAFMIFTVSPLQALAFLIFVVILQQLEGNLIYPRVVGASIGLPGVWVLAAITIGGGLLGVAGMLIGVPLAAALYQLLRDDLGEQPLRR